MSREILFRGKRLNNGEWVYGYLARFRNFANEVYTSIIQINDYETQECSIQDNTCVIPETVGQYTGLTDKNGKKIFEGDIMQLCSACYPCLVYWDGKGWAWKQNGKRREIDLTREKMDTIGNIHDNPELLEDEK